MTSKPRNQSPDEVEVDHLSELACFIIRLCTWLDREIWNPFQPFFDGTLDFCSRHIGTNTAMRPHTECGMHDVLPPKVDFVWIIHDARIAGRSTIGQKGKVPFLDQRASNFGITPTDATKSDYWWEGPNEFFDRCRHHLWIID